MCAACESPLVHYSSSWCEHRQNGHVADIERGNAVLTVTGSIRQLERASHLLRSLQPLVLRRDA